MNKTIDIFTARNAFFASLILAAIILLFLAPKAAVNVDELLHYPHAKNVVNWYYSGGEDISCLETPVTNLKYYGQSVDNFTALINRVFKIENEFLTRHFTGAFFFMLMLFFAAMIALQLTGSFWVATLTVLSMLAMPRLFGQAFGNLKDIPFAAGYSAGIYLIIRFIKELPKVKWSTVLLLAFSIAFTSSVRIGGLILFMYLFVALVAYLILKPFLLKYIVSTKLCLVRLMGQGIVIVIIGYFAGLLFWPYALRDVFLHPLESLHVMEHYKVSIRQIFNGELLWSTQLPWYYLPKWILISTPEYLLLGFLICTVSLIRYLPKPVKSKQLFIELFVFYTLIFPIVYVLIIDANLYSGVRQMLFVLPVLAVLSSVGISRIWKINMKKPVRIALTGAFFILMILPVKHQIKTFPVDYVYFNTVSGGNKKAWSNYEYDYYFHSIKKSSDYIIDFLGDKNVIVATNCNLSNYFEKYPNITYQYTRYLERSSVDWDYGLFGINYLHPFQLKNNTWQSSEIIKTFYHKGNPVAVLLKRKDKTDLRGIEEISAHNVKNAESLIKESLQTDINNVWLFVNLAKLCFIKEDFTEFDDLIKRGLAIHPYYEPLYLLKATKYFNTGKYNEALETLNELIEINPRYKNAAPLLKAVKSKLK